MHTVGMETFYHHGLILCVSEDYSSELLCIHNLGIGTFFDRHGLISCVSEGFLYELLCIHNEDMDTFVLHELILCESEDVIS